MKWVSVCALEGRGVALKLESNYGTNCKKVTRGERRIPAGSSRPPNVGALRFMSPPPTTHTHFTPASQIYSCVWLTPVPPVLMGFMFLWPLHPPLLLLVLLQIYRLTWTPPVHFFPLFFYTQRLPLCPTKTMFSPLSWQRLSQQTSICSPTLRFLINIQEQPGETPRQPLKRGFSVMEVCKC